MGDPSTIEPAPQTISHPARPFHLGYPPPRSVAPGAQPECAADRDCHADRVCWQGRCRFPEEVRPAGPHGAPPDAALEPDGRARWRKRLGGDVDSTGLLLPDGTWVTGCDDGGVWALRAAGP